MWDCFIYFHFSFDSSIVSFFFLLKCHCRTILLLNLDSKYIFFLLVPLFLLFSDIVKLRGIGNAPQERDGACINYTSTTNCFNHISSSINPSMVIRQSILSLHFTILCFSFLFFDPARCDNYFCLLVISLDMVTCK